MRFVDFTEALGLVLTPAQRVLCLVAFDGVEPGELTGDDRELARQLFGDVDTIPALCRRVLVAVVGARSGKSYLAALRLLHLAMTAKLDGLAPGEHAFAIIVAPDLRLARQALRYALGAAKTLELPILSESIDAFTVARLDGRPVSVECLPASRGGSALRGRSLVGAVMDESAFFRDENAVINDLDVYRAIKPRLLPGGQLIVASTPWAEAGLLYEAYRKNFGHPVDALCAHAPTPRMRPDRPELWAGDESDPDYQRELLAVFGTTSGELLFDPALLEACAAFDFEHASPPTLFAGVDLAFRSDAAALVIVAKHPRVLDVVVVEELKPRPGAPLVPGEVIAAFATTLTRFGVHSVSADGHYIESAKEHFAKARIVVNPVAGGNETKVQQHLLLRSLISEKRIRIAQESLRKQLRALRRKAHPGGTITIDAPRRKGAGHSDAASALVLACGLTAGAGGGIVGLEAAVKELGGERALLNLFRGISY